MQGQSTKNFESRMYSFTFSEIDPTFQREKLQLSAISPAVFNFSREPYSRKPHFAAPSDVYLPLYLRLVASPPLMCRSALLRSSRVRTCRYSAGLMRGRRSVRSLCTVDLLIPNCRAAARTVVWLSTMYAARSATRSSIFVRTYTTPNLLVVKHMSARRGI